MKTFCVLLLCGVITVPVHSKDKEREWQVGTLISIDLGVPESSPGLVLPNGNGGGLVVHSEYKMWIYTLETENMIYGCSERGRGWHERPRPFTIGKQVKFTLDEKGNAFLTDQNGKEFKALVVKRSARQTTP